MTFRRLLSTLTTVVSRQTTARALGVICVVGYIVTLATMAASGAGLQRWFFALLVWAVLAYVPLRIVLEAIHTLAPALRTKLIAQTVTRSDRYASRGTIELVVDGLIADTVVMPRIATPAQHGKVRDGVVAILMRVRDDGDIAVARAAQRCLAAVERWVTQSASWSAAQAAHNIQARWATVRALAALAGMTRVLIAAFEDRAGQKFSAGPVDGARAIAYLEACLDFCDQLALEVNVAPWTEPALHLDIAPALRDRIWDAWKAYADIPSPALKARQDLVDTVLT
ncbi:MAG: hypothetical protein AUH31_00520 [Armatimonadetes bacterium 13_1_40CM_64_14]|nr:MAG: hypothetical protein AUH31_00520 [Armatimonadetes bacterium 13_1_40CM_64_14]